MAKVSKIGGIDTVISTVALSLASFINEVKLEVPEIKLVYDEKLSFETAIEKFRADNELADDKKEEAYPLFAFNRSVLRKSPRGAGGRASGILARRNVDLLQKPKHSDIFRLVWGEYDVNFLYITKSIRKLELFEILYLAEAGISSRKDLKVNLEAELGETFSYYAEYMALTDKVFETDNVVYKMVQGQAVVSGFYPVLHATSKHILQINAKIKDVMGGDYESIQIVPET